jgi:dienelactone hydrolase
VKRVLVAGLVLVLVAGLLGAAATAVHLRLPEPSGSYPVGRMGMSWTDLSRPETHTEDPLDAREVVATIWFPAEEGTGSRSDYIETAEGLVSSGEISRPAAVALRFVRDPDRSGARVSSKRESYPVVVFSPGNATNAGFYASIVEELASRGYIVVGVDHPYQVAAVKLADGKVAVYDKAGERSPVAGKIRERVADIRLALDRLTELKAAGESVGPQLDLDRVGIMGHSNGGIAAVEACRADTRLRACMNIDGQLAGGPFSYEEQGGAPDQPFMYLTKESEIHPVLANRFEAGGAGTFRVVVPAAAHDHFGDGALFKPTLNPLARTSDDVIQVARAFSRAFFDHTLRGDPVEVLGKLVVPTDVYVNVYPLGEKPHLPKPG